MEPRPVRIPPQPPEEWDEATRAELGGIVAVGSMRRPVHLPAVVARHPNLLAPYLAWAKAVALHGVLSRRDRELLALRTAYLHRSEFEWGVHHHYALAPGGLTAEEVAAIDAGADAERWTPTERALLRAADDLHATSTVSDATWDELSDAFGDAALLEVVFVVGHCSMLSMVANATGVQPEPGWPSLPPRRRRHTDPAGGGARPPTPDVGSTPGR